MATYYIYIYIFHMIYINILLSIIQIHDKDQQKWIKVSVLKTIIMIVRLYSNWDTLIIAY